MLPKLDTWGPVTVLLVACTILLVGGGVGVTIVNPDTYSFAQLLDDLKTFAIGLGLLGLGRGAHAGLRDLGLGIQLPGTQLAPPDAAHPGAPDSLAEADEDLTDVTLPDESLEGEEGPGDPPLAPQDG